MGDNDNPNNSQLDGQEPTMASSPERSKASSG